MSLTDGGRAENYEGDEEGKEGEFEGRGKRSLTDSGLD